MERQIRPLHTIHQRRGARVPLGLVELGVRSDGRGDVSDGRLLLLVGGAGLGVVGGQGVGAAEVEGAPGGGSRGRGADVDFLRGDGAVVADLSGGDAEGFLAEGVVLWVSGVSGWVKSVRDGDGLTAKMLAMPKMMTTMPDAMTRRQKVEPRESSEVAVLFRLPRMETPMMIMMMPRVTNPWLGERSGQLLAV